MEQHPIRAKIWSSDKVDFGWVKMRRLNFVVSGPKVHHVLFVERGTDCSRSSFKNICDRSL